ncbi:MAG: ABC transporter substrate-binding protein [Desulfohalobiaceae bacterium]
MLRTMSSALLVLLLLLAAGQIQASSRQMQDQADRIVEVPENPSRVVSLAPSITEMVYELGKGDLLVGATMYSDNPAQAQELPKVGSYVNLNVEKILQLKPDLCLATKDGNPVSTVQRLQSLGVPVYALDPRSLEQVMHTLKELGAILRAEGAAKELVADMQGRLQELKTRTRQSQEEPRVFFQIGLKPLVSAGEGTFIQELIDLAGGKNLAAGKGTYPRFSREEVLKLDPEVILISSMANDKEAAQEAVRSWKRYPDITAVAEDRIHVVPAKLFNRPSPRMLDALEILVELLHPGNGLADIEQKRTLE